MEPKWLHSGTIWKNSFTLLKWSHFFLNSHVCTKTVRKINGGHPVDMKMAPPWSHFSSTFFFQCGLCRTKNFGQMPLQYNSILARRHYTSESSPDSFSSVPMRKLHSMLFQIFNLVCIKNREKINHHNKKEYLSSLCNWIQLVLVTSASKWWIWYRLHRREHNEISGGLQWSYHSLSVISCTEAEEGVHSHNYLFNNLHPSQPLN